MLASPGQRRKVKMCEEAEGSGLSGESHDAGTAQAHARAGTRQDWTGRRPGWDD